MQTREMQFHDREAQIAHEQLWVECERGSDGFIEHVGT